jgi:hypothetical protein
MSQQPRLPVGATPGKLALMGVLAIALIVVVTKNWPGKTESAEEAPEEPSLETTTTTEPTTAAPAPAPVATTSMAAPASPFGEFAADEHWPEPPLKEVTKYDPFATAAWAIAAQTTSPAKNADKEKQIGELLAAKDVLIFMTGETRVARIGNQEFRVGDTVGRFKISDITSQGVVLSEVQ